MKRRTLLGLLIGAPLIRPKKLAATPKPEILFGVDPGFAITKTSISRIEAIALLKQRLGLDTYLEPWIDDHTDENGVRTVTGKTLEIPIELHPDIDHLIQAHVPEYNHPENTEH